MKKVFFYLSLLFFGNCDIFSQVISRPVQGLTPDELDKSNIVPQFATDPNQKVMACAGNAANDNWANAQSLAVNGGSVAGTTCGTFEAGETSACNTAGKPTVWYSFVATATTLYVKIDYVSGACYFGSAVYGGNSLPTVNCGDNGPISCQSSSGGPATQIYQLTNLIVGQTYYVQVTYPSGGICGSNGTFNIGVTTANPGGAISNPPPLTSCSSPGPGCWFNSPPTVSQVTTACTSYPLTGAGYNANSVWETVVQFTSSASWSNFSWQAIITSNCALGNVVWFNWTLYDCNCNQITCGDINTLTGNGLACATCYRIRYQMELANCSSFTTIWPYQNVPASPTPCTVLPIDLLYFTANSNPLTKKVNIEWESLAEHNLKEYKIYRSDDGVNFNLLTSVKPKDNVAAGANRKYNYEDNCCTSQETRYYKLEAIDNNGTTSFEKTIAVTFKGNKELIKFAPNPAKDNFVITFGDGAKDVDTQILIMNSVGQVVKKENFISGSFKQMDIYELPTGIYFINVITESSREVLNYKLIKE
ncbi:MAG TPA: T9SS type A sorting domain-containing protein [Bacteroidia bacterium]|jgi:hypothetical protein|nr:T9SS type A sorting domain-containing protein [Bacteroidia bacterium]